MLARIGRISVFVAALFIVAPVLHAQTHVVSPADLQQETLTATQTRQQQIDTVNRFLSTPGAEKALKDANIDPQQVHAAVATLNDAELADLSNRASKAQNDFAAGSLTNNELLWIIIAIAVIILLIVALR